MANGYRPQKSLLAFTEALSDRVLESVYYVNEAGTVAGFAATAQFIFLANIESFSDASKSGGYSTASGDTWSFVRDEDLVLASNFTDPIQQFTIGASNQFGDVPDIPKAKYLLPVGENLFLLFLDEEGTVNPFRVRWSARDDFLNFPAPGTTEALQVGSDAGNLSSDYGEITGGAAGLTSADAVIFQETAVTSVRRVGGRRGFALDVIEGARGCNAPGSIVQEGGDVYYLDNAGIYRTNGVSSVSIGERRIDRFLYDNVNTFSLDDVRSGTDVREKIIYWNLPDVNGDRFTIVYSYDIDEFTFLDSSFDVQVFTRSITPGLTFDDLQRISPILDELPASLDSDLWKGGGLPTFSGFDAENRLGSFSGPNLAATLRTPEAELMPDQRAYVQFSRPLIDTRDVLVRPVTRENLSDGLPKIGADKGPNAEGRCFHRTTARYWALEMDVTEGADWTFAQGLQVVYAPGGRRQPTAFRRTADLPLFLLTDDDQLIVTDEGRPIVAEIFEPPAVITVLITDNGDTIVDDAGVAIRIS